MTNIKVLKKDEYIANIEVKGHSDYDDIGKDIVCASISSMVTLVINSIVRFNENAIEYTVKDGYINIDIKMHNEYIDTLLISLIDLLQDLAKSYPKNVKIII